MKNNFLILLLLLNFHAFSQEKIDDKIINKKRVFFTQFDVSIPLRGNPNRGEININGTYNDSWLLIDGINTKFGYGIHQNKWIGISLNSGIDWKAYSKLVAVPIYSNLRIAPKTGQDSRIILQLGYGKGFALGRGNLQGYYKKISLGFEDQDEIIFFIELNEYNIKLNGVDKIGSLSLGLSLIVF